VIERFGALARGGDEDLELSLHLRLADILLEAARPDGSLDGLFLLPAGTADDSFFFHF
jgi:hypothetical protein